MFSPRFVPAVAVFCRNNARTIGEVAGGALRYCRHVIVVDDGSTDGTARAASHVRRVHVVRFPEGRGKGAALRAAMDAARGFGATHLVSVDGDGKHRPSDIPALLRESREHPAAIVVGARDLEEPGVSRARRLERALSNFWMKMETGVSVPDTRSGFRVYPLDLVTRLSLYGRRHEFEVEVLAKALWAGLPARSVTIGVDRPAPRRRARWFRLLEDNLRIAAMNALLVGRALLPIPFRKLVGARRVSFRYVVHHWREFTPRQVWNRFVAARATPLELAVSTAVGIVIGCSPFYGLHTWMCLYLAARLNLNPVAVVAGAYISIPVVAPFIILASIQTGSLVLDGRFDSVDVRKFRGPDFSGWMGVVGEYFSKWLVGGAVFGSALGLLIGLVIYFALAWRRRRRERA